MTSLSSARPSGQTTPTDDKCPSCKSGVLSRNKKPDALGRIMERCDACSLRRVVEEPIAPTKSVQHNGGSVPLSVAPVAVVGEPCPCCHRNVRALPICVACKKNRRVLGKTKCAECSKPKGPAPRFCVKCGTNFTPEGSGGGLAAYKCAPCSAKSAAKKRKRAA